MAAIKISQVDLQWFRRNLSESTYEAVRSARENKALGVEHLALVLDDLSKVPCTLDVLGMILKINKKVEAVK